MTLLERFYKYTIKSSGCWIWTGCMDGSGRPLLRVNGKNVNVSRIVWMLFRNPGLTNKTYICHTCDNGLCVNPDHLYEGTASSNMKDRDERNRLAYGSRHGMSKMNEELVVKLRQDYSSGVSCSDLAVKYGIHRSVAWAIASRKTWKRVL